MNKVIDFKSHKTNHNIKSDKLKIQNKNLMEIKNELFILIGIPCSGKSTYASKYLNNPHTVIISSDKIRKEMTGTYEFSCETNDVIFDIAKSRIIQALSQGFNVVFDSTNTNKKYRRDFIEISKSYGCHITAIVFKVPLSLCLKRNSVRNIDRKVPEKVIIGMSLFDSNISKREGFDQVVYINHNPNNSMNEHL